MTRVCAIAVLLLSLAVPVRAQVGGTPGSAPLILINMGSSGDKSLTDAGIESYITEYFAYLSSKYPQSAITTTSLLISPVGSFQAIADGNNCGQSFVYQFYNTTAAIKLHANVVILRAPSLDDIPCTAAQITTALQNIYNELTAAGIIVWVQTANPVSYPADSNAPIEQAVTTYILAHFPHTVDMTTGFTNPDYSSNCTYYTGSGGTCGGIYNAAGNTLAAQRLQAALPY
jgi:hypothetical protein